MRTAHGDLDVFAVEQSPAAPRSYEQLSARAVPVEVLGVRLLVAHPEDLITSSGEPAYGVRRAIIATLGLAGPRVTELCQLDNQGIDLSKARFHIRDSKTQAGIRTVDIHRRLLDELVHYTSRCGPAAMHAPAFPTRTGAPRDKDNVRSRMIAPVVARANELRTRQGQPPIRAHVTPHTFRRTYITFLVAGDTTSPTSRLSGTRQSVAHAVDLRAAHATRGPR